MKKVFLSMAAFALVMASCSKEEVPGTNPDGVANAVAIRIGQTVKGLETKAPVVNGSDVVATVLMHDANSTTPNWSSFTPKSDNSPTGTSNAFEDDNERATYSTATFKAGTNLDVVLTPALYYPSTNYAHIMGVAPAGTVSNTEVTMKVKDGMQDVMVSESVDAGTKGSPTGSIVLSFAHKTTQLTFKMKLVAQASDGLWGGTASLKSISIKNAQLPTGVTIASGDVIWGDAALFTVPGINSVPIAATEGSVGSPVMINALGTVVIDAVITAGGKDWTFNDVTVKNDSDGNLAAVIGSSHEITLTVKEPKTVADSEKAITAKATVTPWTVGSAGSADLN